MKAIIYRENGGPDVLQRVDRDLPAPGPGEVRVRVAVSGVNPTDWQARSGAAPPKQFSEVTPHLDGAGVIDAIGEGVDPSRVGQRVWLFMAAAGRPTGTAAELTVVPAERAVPLPDEASFDVGASLGVPALTAQRALTVAEDGPRRLRPGALDGRVVLAAGGAGAVGHAVIQLARWAGATVISTISGPEKARLATAAGAHHVINYREGDPAAEIRKVAPGGVDIIAEVALGANLRAAIRLLLPMRLRARGARGGRRPRPRRSARGRGVACAAAARAGGLPAGSSAMSTPSGGCSVTSGGTGMFAYANRSSGDAVATRGWSTGESAKNEVSS
ncbi:uncharacterized protein SOCEGT47_033190 [Sorangium cellulosum]|uniref:Enoyl reductase (ER) domain-containing protein n=1 Tax=Sorangium cellulosum TaxID=56 RepID=A0A4P2Q0Q9_SORCE|nr:NADPH:quinone reductase [Sorangium cellulosum]AUX22807.1 uncharacterized protein SOCEGT47_033190 [Sorangium cellulosum]